MKEPFATISSLMTQPDGRQRLGQALWMLVDKKICTADLLWAQRSLGPNGDVILWNGLCDGRAIEGPDFHLRAQPLADWLCELWPKTTPSAQGVRLVWTLPPTLHVLGIEADGYSQATIEIIESAINRILIVSPYLEQKGMGRVHEALLNAMNRGVSVTLVTHAAQELSSMASVSLEKLRRDSVGSKGFFRVLSATEVSQVLVHLKVVVADGEVGTLGSANLTGKGLGFNLEAGAVLGSTSAGEIERVIDAAIKQETVSQVFSTAEDGVVAKAQGSS